MKPEDFVKFEEESKSPPAVEADLAELTPAPENTQKISQQDAIDEPLFIDGLKATAEQMNAAMDGKYGPYKQAEMLLKNAYIDFAERINESADSYLVDYGSPPDEMQNVWQKTQDALVRAAQLLADDPSPATLTRILNAPWASASDLMSSQTLRTSGPWQAIESLKAKLQTIQMPSSELGAGKASPEIRSTADAMNAGLRTSTTRPVSWKVGDYIDFSQDGVRGFWRVKEIKKYNFDNPADVAAWESTERWNYARIKQEGGPLLAQLRNPNSKTFLLERVETLPQGVTAKTGAMSYKYGPDKDTFDPSFLKLDATAPAATAAQQGGKIEFEESTSTDYAVRTRINATESDVTIAYAYNYRSAGEIATDREVTAAKKQFYKFGVQFGDDVERARRLAPIYERNAGQEIIINIAGNGEYEKGMISTDQLTEEIAKDLAFLQKKGVGIVLVRSGGQTGADEAGVKAAAKLGIPAKVLAPKGWKFRTGAPGGQYTDQTGREAFLARFGAAAVVSPSSPAAAVRTFDLPGRRMAVENRPAWEIPDNIYSSIGKTLGLSDDERRLRASLTNPTSNIIRTAKGGSNNSLDAKNIDKAIPVVMDGKVFPSAEHAFFYMEQRAGGDRLDLPGKEAIMAEVIFEKFRQNPELVTLLEKVASESGKTPVQWMEEQVHYTGRVRSANSDWEGAGRDSAFIRSLIAGYETYELRPDPYAELDERGAFIKRKLVEWAQNPDNQKLFPSIDRSPRTRNKQNYFLSADTSIPLGKATRSWTGMQTMAAGITEANKDIMRRTVGATGAFGMPYEATEFTRRGSIAEILPTTAEQATVQDTLRAAALQSGVDISMGGSRQDANSFINAPKGKESMLNINDRASVLRFVRRFDSAVKKLIEFNQRMDKLGLPKDHRIRKGLGITPEQARSIYDVLMKAHEILKDYGDPATRLRSMGLTRSLAGERGNIAPGLEALAKIAEIQGQFPRVETQAAKSLMPREVVGAVQQPIPPSKVEDVYNPFRNLSAEAAQVLADSEGYMEQPGDYRSRKIYSRPLAFDDLTSEAQRFLDSQDLLEGEVTAVKKPFRGTNTGIVRSNEVFEARLTEDLSDDVLKNLLNEGFDDNTAKTWLFSLFGEEGADRYEDSPRSSRASVEASLDYSVVKGGLSSNKDTNLNAAMVIAEKLFPGIFMNHGLPEDFVPARKASFRPIYELEGGYDAKLAADINKKHRTLKLDPEKIPVTVGKKGKAARIAYLLDSKGRSMDVTVLSLYNLSQNDLAFNEIMLQYLSPATKNRSTQRLVSRNLVGPASELSMELSGLIKDGGSADPRVLVRIMREGTTVGEDGKEKLTTRARLARSILKSTVVALPSSMLAKYTRIPYSDQVVVKGKPKVRVVSPFRALPGGAVIDADENYKIAFGMPKVEPYKIVRDKDGLRVQQIARVQVEEVAKAYVPSKAPDKSKKLKRLERELLLDARLEKPLATTLENAEDIRLAKLNFLIDNIDLLYQTETWHNGGQPVARMASEALKSTMTSKDRGQYENLSNQENRIRRSGGREASVPFDITGAARVTRWYNVEVPALAVRPVLDVVNYSADRGPNPLLTRNLVQRESLDFTGDPTNPRPIMALSRWDEDLERVLADMDPGKAHKAVRDLFIEADEILKIAYSAGQSLGYGSLQPLRGAADTGVVGVLPDVQRANIQVMPADVASGHIRILADHVAYQARKVGGVFSVGKPLVDATSPIVPNFAEEYDVEQRAREAEADAMEADRKANGPFFDEDGQEISKEEYRALQAEMIGEAIGETLPPQEPKITEMFESFEEEFGNIRDQETVFKAAQDAGVPIKAYIELMNTAGRDLGEVLQGKIEVKDSEVLSVLKRNDIVPSSGRPIMPEALKAALLVELAYQGWDDYSYQISKDVDMRIPIKYKGETVYATMYGEAQPGEEGRTEPKILLERGAPTDMATEAGRNILIDAGIIDTSTGTGIKGQATPQGRILYNAMLAAMSEVFDAVSVSVVQQTREQQARNVYYATPEGESGRSATESAESTMKYAYKKYQEPVDSKVVIDAAERFFGTDTESFELFRKLFSHLSGKEFPSDTNAGGVTRGDIIKAFVGMPELVMKYYPADPDAGPKPESPEVKKALADARDQFDKARKYSVSIGREDLAASGERRSLLEIAKRENWDAIREPILSIMMQQDLQYLSAQLSWLSNEFGIEEKVLVDAIGGEQGLRAMVMVGPGTRGFRAFERALSGRWKDMADLRQLTDVQALPGQESIDQSRGEVSKGEDGKMVIGFDSSNDGEYSPGQALSERFGEEYDMVPYEQGKLLGATGGSVRDMLERVGRPLRNAPGSMGAMHGLGGFGAGALADLAYMNWKGYLSPEALAMSAAFNSLNFAPKNIAPKLGVAGAVANIGLNAALGGDVGRSILQTIGGLAGGAIGAFGGGFGAIGGSIAGSEIGDYIWSDILGNKYKPQSVWNKSVAPDPTIKLRTNILP
jgi:hypothetical protein